MGFARWGALVAVLLALVAACGTAQAEPAPNPDPMLKEWPHWPYPTTCHGLAFDPVVAFGGPTGVELGSRPSEVALREFLHETQSWAQPFGPLSGWRLLAETEGQVEFASGRLSRGGGPSVMSFDYENGEWKPSTFSSGCQPTSIVGGLHAITWSLAADQKALRKGTSAIWIDLGPGPCASGRSQNARALKPVFRSIGKNLLMVMRLRPLPPGYYTCQGILDPPMKVKLPGRLGKRRLYDGGTYPPVDVRESWRQRTQAG